MSKWISAALFLLLSLLFLIANRGAYQGYFEGDALDNISWAPNTPVSTYVKELLSPRISPVNFRPVGHAFFAVLGRSAGLRFPAYIATLHTLHLINLWLLFLLLRRLGVERVTAGAGVLFFAFHVAVFDAYWKPMYVFDVLCALFSLLCLLAWVRRRWLLSFLCFWLAFKSKEVAVMLPAVLACYELCLGEKKWKPLLPFFLVSLTFGLQGLFFSPNVDNDYTLRLKPAGLWKSLAFYSSQVFLAPYHGLGLLAVPLLTRNRRLWFGVAAAAILVAPMLLLPDRLYGAYLYVPLAALAMAFPPLDSGRARILAAVLFFLWLPCNYRFLIDKRRAALTIAQENRTYVEALGAVVRPNSYVRTYIYDGSPPTLHRWGVEGAIRYFAGPGMLQVYSVADRDLRKAYSADGITLLVWDAHRRRLETLLRSPGRPDASEITLTRLAPMWQLEDGWYPVEDNYRWIGPRATARLHRPAEAQHFEVGVNAGPRLIADIGKSQLEVLLGGVRVGRAEFTRPGPRKVSWALPPGPGGPIQVEFRVAPVYRTVGDPRVLGIALTSFGFVP